MNPLLRRRFFDSRVGSHRAKPGFADDCWLIATVPEDASATASREDDKRRGRDLNPRRMKPPETVFEFVLGWLA
jgi:hypothetical protein